MPTTRSRATDRIPVPEAFHKTKEEAKRLIAAKSELQRVTCGIYSLLFAVVIAVIVFVVRSPPAKVRIVREPAGEEKAGGWSTISTTCESVGSFTGSMGVPPNCTLRVLPDFRDGTAIECGPTVMPSLYVSQACTEPIKVVSNNIPMMRCSTLVEARNALFLELEWENAWFQDSSQCQDWINNTVAEQVVKKTVIANFVRRTDPK
eukprot:g2867.t1